MDLWVHIVYVYVGTVSHPYGPTNLLVVTILVQASCVYTAGTAVDVYSCRRLELPCMLAAAAAAGKFWLLLLLLAAATGCCTAAASSSSRNQKLSSSQQPAAASMGMAAAWLLHGHAAWAWLLHGHAAASKPGCMVHGKLLLQQLL